MEIQTLEIAGQIYHKVGECLVPDYIANFSKKESITLPEHAEPYFSALKTADQEMVQILTLDASHAPIKVHTITIGLVNQSQIHCREVFRKAIEDNAVSVIVAHNHPSGNSKASEADLSATRKLAQAGKIIGIELLDHLIVARNQIKSIRNEYANCWVSSF